MATAYSLGLAIDASLGVTGWLDFLLLPAIHITYKSDVLLGEQSCHSLEVKDAP